MLIPRAEPLVVRVSGGLVCRSCGKQLRNHPRDPRADFPTFVQLCELTATCGPLIGKC